MVGAATENALVAIFVRTNGTTRLFMDDERRLRAGT